MSTKETMVGWWVSQLELDYITKIPLYSLNMLVTCQLSALSFFMISYTLMTCKLTVSSVFMISCAFCSKQYL